MSEPPASSNIATARLMMRRDLKTTLQEVSGNSYMMLEDPVTSKFYRIGKREWDFVRLLDGNHTIREAVWLYRKNEHVDALTEKEISFLCNWLGRTELLVNRDSTEHPLQEVAQTHWWANPLFIKVPLFNPNHLLDAATKMLAWSVCKQAFLFWLILCVSAAYVVLSNFDRFSRNFSEVLAVDNWIYLFLTWFGLKLIHETYHGIICKKYGGTVPRCGMMLILFSPVAFVDVTSSWRFRSKWHRIFTAAGGMYSEFFVAAIAAWIWAYTETGLLNQICHNIVTMASVSTLLFNANFLMRFDGYYIFSDLVGIQNIYVSGQQYIRYIGRQYLLGIDSVAPVLPAGKEMIVRLYAVASLLWRWIFTIGIIAVAATLFHGFGIVLAAMAAVTWFVIPLAKLARILIKPQAHESPNRVRVCTLSLGCLCLVSLIVVLPWPGGITAPAIVEYSDMQLVRVDSPGFIDKVHVQTGQRVDTGDILLTIRNPETESKLEDLELRILQSKRKSQILLRDNDRAGYQVEEKNRETLRKQRDELARQVDSLTIYATMPGRIIGRDLETLHGQYFEMGEVLLGIGEDSKKELKVSIAQKDLKSFVNQQDSTPYVRVRGRSRIRDTRLTRVDPRASVRLPHDALAAPLGGPLTVTNAESSEGSYQLLEPRFLGTVTIPNAEACNLFAGELAKVRIRTVDETIGEHIYDILNRWLRAKMDPFGNAG